MKGARKTKAIPPAGTDVRGYGASLVGKLLVGFQAVGGISGVDTSARETAERAATRTDKQAAAAASRVPVQIRQINFRCDTEVEALIDQIGQKLGLTNAKGSTLTSAVLRRAVQVLAKHEGLV